MTGRLVNETRRKVGYPHPFWICAALTIAVIAVYYPIWTCGFVDWDDSISIYQNQNIQAGITLKTIKWIFYNDYWHMWHPVTWLSHILDWQLFGSNAAGHHLTNLIFHIANTLLLFTVLKRMTNALWQSAFVVALFALHPLHVESVAWVSERKDVLSTFFWLLTMWAYVHYAKEKPSAKPGAKYYYCLLTVIFFALGLMSKPMLVTLPFVLLLLDYWPLERLNTKRAIWQLLIEKIPLFAMALAASIITFIIQEKGGATEAIEGLSLSDRLANASISYVQYIIKMIWPIHLAVFYPHPGRNVSLQYAVISAVFLLSVTILVLRFTKNRRYLVVGWFWYLGTLVPVIGIIQVGRQAYADRYTYVPYIGLFIMLAWGLPQLLAKWPQRKIVLGLSMVLVLATLGIIAHRQTSYWKNNYTLFLHANEVTKNNYLAHNNLGNFYARFGRYTEAIKSYEQAVKIKPDYTLAHNNLGIAYGSLDRLPEAIDAFKQAIKSNPNFAAAYNNLGVAYGGLGRSTEAIDAYSQAIKINPNFAEAYTNLGIVYAKFDRGTEAIDAFKQAIKIKPDYAEAHKNLGYAYLTIGDKNSALAEYNILKSLNSELANNLFKEINK
jgi:Flp pilus assembly protein TadD